MKTIYIIFLGTLCSLGLTYQVNEQEYPLPKSPLQPGDLLRSLDALTSDAQAIYSPLQKTPPLKLAERRVYHDDESNNDNQESDSEYDYDKAYENFVNKYFDKGQEELESEDSPDDDDGFDEKAAEIDDAAPYRFSDETDNEPKEEEKSSSTGSKKCERIQIDNQNCKVCEDPKTNEKSKTCSYSSEDKPKSYGYSRQRSTKHSSDDDDDDDEDDDKSSEAGKSRKRETSSNNKSKFKPRRTSIEQFLKPSSPPPDDQLQCIRKFEDGMICFYCGSTSENTRECIVDKNHLKKRRLDESSKKDTATKKIFKRMVTYSFKNDAEPKFKENTYSAFQGY